jgi:hypothetical protein
MKWKTMSRIFRHYARREGLKEGAGIRDCYSIMGGREAAGMGQISSD